MKPEARLGGRSSQAGGRHRHRDSAAAALCLLSPWGGFHNENDYLLFLPWK